jgi:hypothetical protein
MASSPNNLFVFIFFVFEREFCPNSIVQMPPVFAGLLLRRHFPKASKAPLCSMARCRKLPESHQTRYKMGADYDVHKGILPE